MSTSLITVSNLDYNYYTKQGEIEALKNINLRIEEGDFISMVGPSGCGKTTLLSLVSGLLKPQSGILLYQGRKEIPKNFFGYMLQKDQLFEWRSVKQNIFLPLEIQKINTKENQAYALSLLEKYGLSGFENKRPRELSGGMRQRVALIRTLALQPKVLLLDEPFSALDFQTRLEVQQDVLNILKAENKTAILVTHDIDEAVSMSDYVAILTPRPARIKEIVKTNHERRSTVLERREKTKLSYWQKKIFQ